MIQFFTHLGLAYNAYRVMQDAGLWTYDPEAFRNYFEAWTEEHKAAKAN